MSLDTSKITAAVAAISPDVDKVVAMVTAARNQTATDEVAAQAVLDAAAAALVQAQQKLDALVNPQPAPTTPAA